MAEEVVFRMVLDPSDMQRFLSAAAPGGAGGAFGGPPSGGFTTAGGDAARTDPSFMSIFKPLAALEIIKGGIAQLVASSQVMSTYLEAGKKIVGAFADLLMAALSPFINVGLLFMTTLLSAFVSSGLFQKLLAWSQAMSKDMAKWINDHAPQIESFIKSAVEMAGNIFSVVGDVGGQIISKFVALTDWFDNNLGGFGEFASNALRILAVIAAAVVVGKGLSVLPGLGGLGMGWGAAAGGGGAVGMMGKVARMSPYGSKMMGMGPLGTAALGFGAGQAAGYGLEQMGAPDWTQDMAKFGMTGAGLGAPFGPWGMAAGALGGMGMVGLHEAGVPMGPLDKLFKSGGGGGGGGGDVKVENSGNTVHNVYNINSKADAKEVAAEVAKTQDTKYGALGNTRN